MPLYPWRRRRNLWRLEPVSRSFGLERGQGIGRYYMERFLDENADNIRGRVLEVGDARYTLQFGKGRVSSSDVLHVVPGNAQATLVGDLTTGEGIPREAFDCIILTQTLQFIYDMRAAVANSYAALARGGTLLATFTGISQISRYDMERWGDYWRVTDASARRLFGDVFGGDNVKVAVYGNVLAACAYLQCLVAHELSQQELDYHDEDYQLVVAIRASKTKGRA